MPISTAFKDTCNSRQKEVLAVSAGSSAVFSCTIFEFVRAWAEFAPVGDEITPTGVFDPANVATDEANLINGDLTDLTYNNLSAGTNNKAMPAIDLGSAQTVSLVKVYWWNNAYTASNYTLQGSVDGSTWTDLATGLNSTGIVGTSNNPQEINVSGAWRYLRVLCVTGNNASFCGLSEMEAFGVGETVVRADQSVDGLVLQDDGNGFVEAVNSTGVDLNLCVTFDR